jgi:adenylate kinase
LNFVILGPQGSGKGTQASALTERIGLTHLASGDVLRAARASGTELGNEVKRYYDAGELVPDEITVRLLLEEMRSIPGEHNVLLDGFPRTVAQAEALDRALEGVGERVDAVIELVVPLEEVKRRMLGRRICPVDGAVYNIETQPPKTPGRCDNDGAELVQRADDNPEAIQKRLEIWERENDSLTGYYRDQGVLRQVNADRPPEAVADDIVAVLQGAGLSSAGR